MKKLKIQELKVQSFVTSLSKESENTLKGGDCPGNSDNLNCNSAAACENTAAAVCWGTCGNWLNPVAVHSTCAVFIQCP